MGSATAFLDELPILDATVGTGTVGLDGQLGTKGKPVRVGGEAKSRSIAAAAPSVLSFYLGKRFSNLACSAAMNDDTVWDNVAGTFKIVGDGKVLALVEGVRAKSGPVHLSVKTAGVNHLQLVTDASGPRFPHTVWVDPQLRYDRRVPADDRVPPEPPAKPVPSRSDSGGMAAAAPLGATDPGTAGWIRSVFGQVQIGRPSERISSGRCIVTVASAGFHDLLDGFLNTLLAHGCVPDATAVVMIVNGDEKCEQVAATYGARIVPCASDLPPSMIYKTAMYSAARIVCSEAILCIDADTLITGDLRPIFYAIRACPPDRLFICRELNDRIYHIRDAFGRIYGGTAEEWVQLGGSDEDARSPLVVNTGVLAGSRHALHALDVSLRSLPGYAVEWERGNPYYSWREQMLVNLVLARSGVAVELDPSYNVQLLETDVSVEEHPPYRRAVFRGRTANIIHFNGPSRSKYPQLVDQFAVRFG
jgi:hypothetical protein